MTAPLKVAMVVPTVRETSIQRFFQEWEPFPWDLTIIVEDQPSPTYQLPAGVAHFTWQDIEDNLGADQWIISRRSSAIRCFGFWKAWQAGADVIATLDDDCYPLWPDGHDRWAADHRNNLFHLPHWTTTVSELRVRGLPYRALGVQSDVVANMGLWANCPDLDAIQTLAGVPAERFRPVVTNRLMPNSQYFPFCGMNFAFRREWAPASYFPLSGANSPFDRFDDIWFGVVFQRICRRLGKSVACGEPVIWHDRASDPLVNLVKEAPGIQAHEIMWQIIDALDLDDADDTVEACVAAIATQLSQLSAQQCPLEVLLNYLRQYGAALQRWLSLFAQPAHVAAIATE